MFIRLLPGKTVRYEVLLPFILQRLASQAGVVLVVV